MKVKLHRSRWVNGKGKSGGGEGGATPQGTVRKGKGIVVFRVEKNAKSLF